jgi:hypothetical protein
MKPLSWWRSRLIPVLLLAGMALFLNGQASRREPNADLTNVSVLEGTAAGHRTFTETVRTNRRTSQRRVFALTLDEYPSNVTFRLEQPPPSGAPDGTPIRLEVAADATDTIDRATRYPDATYMIRALGATVAGRTIYSASAAADRAAGASHAYRIAALICALLAAAWTALVVAQWRRQT